MPREILERKRLNYKDESLKITERNMGSRLHIFCNLGVKVFSKRDPQNRNNKEKSY